MRHTPTLTSAMRRIARDALRTTITWTANALTPRWIFQPRTDPAPELEIWPVFGVT